MNAKDIHIQGAYFIVLTQIISIMNQSNVVFKYENTNVTFLTEGGNVKVNATEMAKKFGKLKKPSYWLHTQQAKEYIQTLAKVKKSDLADLLSVTYGGNQPGTWMSEDLALEFSRWLSPEFGIWCNDKIKELLKTGATSLTEQERMLFKQRIGELESKVEELVPDAEFGRSVRQNEDCIPLTIFSDILVSNGCNIGRNQLYEYLREADYVYKKGDIDRNFPTRRATKMRILETRYPKSTTEFGPTVYVTPRGIKYFLRRRGQIEIFMERQKAKVKKIRKIGKYSRY